jgi:hypothetical protein
MQQRARQDGALTSPHIDTNVPGRSPRIPCAQRLLIQARSSSEHNIDEAGSACRSRERKKILGLSGFLRLDDVVDRRHSLRIDGHRAGTPVARELRQDQIQASARSLGVARAQAQRDFVVRAFRL